MALAALEAGMAFNNSSVTIVHGMSRPMGALFHVPHGISNAMLLNVCLDYAKEGAADRFAHIAVKCGLGKPEDSSREAYGAGRNASQGDPDSHPGGIRYPERGFYEGNPKDG